MEYVEFEDVRLIRQTEKAVLVRFPDEEEAWIPWSCIEDNADDISKDDDKGSLCVAEWFAIKEGWI